MKNKDEVSLQLTDLIFHSKNKQFAYIAGLSFTDEDLNKKIEDMKNQEGLSKEQKFLGSAFRAQIRDLLKELRSCYDHFIRCVRPNDQKKSKLFQGKLTIRQMRYLGVLESIKVRRESYPIRLSFQKFWEKYKELYLKKWPKENINYEEISKEYIND